MSDEQADNVRASKPIVIGPEHPEYRQRLAAQENTPEGRQRTRRNHWLMALGFTAGGFFLWWSNVHDARTTNHYGPFLLLFSPTMIVGGSVGVYTLLTQKETPRDAVVPDVSGGTAVARIGGIVLACLVLGAWQYYQVHH